MIMTVFVIFFFRINCHVTNSLISFFFNNECLFRCFLVILSDTDRFLQYNYYTYSVAVVINEGLIFVITSQLITSLNV